MRLSAILSEIDFPLLWSIHDSLRSTSKWHYTFPPNIQPEETGTVSPYNPTHLSTLCPEEAFLVSGTAQWVILFDPFVTTQHNQYSPGAKRELFLLYNYSSLRI